MKCLLKKAQPYVLFRNRGEKEVKSLSEKFEEVVEQLNSHPNKMLETLKILTVRVSSLESKDSEIAPSLPQPQAAVPALVAKL